MNAHRLARSPRAPLHGTRCRLRALCHPCGAGWRLGGSLCLAGAGPHHRRHRRHLRAHGRRDREAAPFLRRAARPRHRLRDVCVRAGAGAAAGWLSARRHSACCWQASSCSRRSSIFPTPKARPRTIASSAFRPFGTLSPSMSSPSRCPPGSSRPWFSTCVVLTFVPMRWAHPLRTPLLWPVTLAAMGLWCVAACLTVWSGFPASPLVAGHPVGRRRLWCRPGPFPQQAGVGGAIVSYCRSNPNPPRCVVGGRSSPILEGWSGFWGTHAGRRSCGRWESWPPRSCGHRQLPHRGPDGHARAHPLVVLSSFRCRSRLLAPACRP